jgi:hypothetical protein
LVFTFFQQDVPAARGLGKTLAFCIGSFILHSAFGRLILYFREHFVAAHIFILEPSDVIPDLLLYCIRFLLLIIKGQICALWFHILCIDEILHCIEYILIKLY